MEIALVNTFSVDFDRTTKNIETVELDKKLKNYLIDKEYGESIHTYLIGIICVHPKFDGFFPARKPVYVEDKMITLEKGLGEIHVCKSLTFSIKIDYTKYYFNNTEEGLRIIANAILETIRDLKYPTKIKDFDKERFYNDLLLFFNEEGLI